MRHDKTDRDLAPLGAIRLRYRRLWSETLYDQEGYQVANPLNRFALSSWMPFKDDPDGSLSLYFQNDSPGKDKETNWLPAPKRPFTLTMRCSMHLAPRP